MADSSVCEPVPLTKKSLEKKVASCPPVQGAEAVGSACRRRRKQKPSKMSNDSAQANANREFSYGKNGRRKVTNKQRNRNANDYDVAIKACACTVIVQTEEGVDVQETIASIRLTSEKKVQFQVADVRSIRSRAEIWLELSNQSQGNKIMQLIRQFCQNVTVRLRHESLSQGPSENLLQKTKNAISLQAREVEAEHDDKIHDVQQQLESGARMNRSLSLKDFEVFSSLRDAKQAKLNELLLQKKEFAETLSSCLQKLAEKPTIKEAVQIREAWDRECSRLKSALPMYARKSEIVDTIINNQVCIVLGETGSGKSTQLAQYLYEAGFGSTYKGQIVCTQPRKVAAISLARRVAYEFGCLVGDIVGYRVGSDSKEGVSTTIKYVTDRTLLNECMKDPQLSKYSCIIVDEAHERSLFTDLLLGLLKQLLVRRPELRLIVTSATIDPKVFFNFFNSCPIVTVSGRLFPIEVVYCGEHLLLADGKAEGHVEAAVNQVWKVIQDGETRGDILVFLTSQADIESACKQLSSYPGAQQHILCLPLHGRLQPNEQQKVFESAPPGKRKVVFSTNVAETSVTIAGITCVIDTGLAKEKLYDAKKNMARLQMCMISRSSADQRKGRAGRTEQGICYRLYSETQFSTMRVNSQPEILCTHLGLAMLMFLEMGIANPQDFDFVESPPRDALRSAMATLEDLGAVSEGKLTDLGQRLVKLGIEPRFGKFLLRAIEEGVAFDALCAVVLFTATSGVFYRAGTAKEKEAADKLKLRFCHQKGDVLTSLNVFREWWHAGSDKDKNQWCVENSINAKSMRSAREAINEIRKLLATELKVKLDIRFSLDELCNEIIPRLIVECFFVNVARFTGHQKTGYILLKDASAVVLHPSSALCMLGTLPKWVVFEQVWSTSQDFIMNINMVEEDDICKMVQQGTIKCDLAEVESKVLCLTSVPNLGSTILRNLIGPKGASIRALENSVQNAVSAAASIVGTRSFCTVEIASNEASLTLFCTPSTTHAAMKIITERLEAERKTFSAELLEKPLVMAQSRFIRVSLGAGGSVKQLLLPDDFRTLIIEQVPESMPQQEVEDLYKSFGTCEVRRYTMSTRNWGSVIYDDQMDAKRAADFCVELGLPVRPRSNGTERLLFGVNISWLRRPALGYAYVSFEAPESAAEYMLSHRGPLLVHNQNVRVQLHRQNETQLYLQNVPISAKDEDIKLAIQAELPNCKIPKVVIPRKKVQLPSELQLNRYMKVIETKVKDVMAARAMNCYVSPVRMLTIKPESSVGRAFITFSDINCAIAAAAAFHEALYFEDARVEAHLDVSSTIFVKDVVYRIFEQELNTFVSSHQQQHAAQHIAVDIKKLGKDGNWQIRVGARLAEHAAKIREHIATILAPLVYKADDRATFQLFTNAAGQSFISRLMNTNAIHIEYDRRFWMLNIYGARAVQETILTEIEQFKTSNSRVEVVKEISLRDSGKPRGFLKSLASRYGFDLDPLRTVAGAAVCCVNLRRHSLTFSGSAESLSKLEALLDGLASELAEQPIKPFSPKARSDPECAVCLTEIATGKAHYLELCGHAYCSECLQLVIVNSVRSKMFPIICCHDSCALPLAIADLRQLLNDSEESWQDLVEASVSAYVTQSANSSKEYKYCPTANCPMIYLATPEEGSCWHCLLCQHDTCTRCHVAYHEGLTCDLYQRLKRDPDHGLTMWLRKDKRNRALCPKCRAPIEKDGGCNHVECQQCHVHMCWLCKMTFNTGDETYNHLGSCRVQARV